MSCLAKRLAWIAGIITSLAVIGSAIVFAADQRYSTTVYVNETVKATAEQTRVEFRYSLDQKRKVDLEDKIFELTQIPLSKRTGQQNALLDRALRQLNELNARWVNPPPGSVQ